MRTGSFLTGVITGFAGAAATVMAVNYTLAGTNTGRTISRTAHKTAGMVRQAVQDAANTVDKMVQ